MSSTNLAKEETTMTPMNKLLMTLRAVVLIFGVMAVQLPELVLAGPGCTGVPDYIFKSACEIHDECYDSARLSREGCDNEFLIEMHLACDSNPDRSNCMDIANLYHWGVTAFAACHYAQGSLPECQVDHSGDTIVSGDIVAALDYSRDYSPGTEPCGEPYWSCSASGYLDYVVPWQTGTGCRVDRYPQGGC
jgi:hypothetical protein